MSYCLICRQDKDNVKARNPVFLNSVDGKLYTFSLIPIFMCESCSRGTAALHNCGTYVFQNDGAET